MNEAGMLFSRGEVEERGRGTIKDVNLNASKCIKRPEFRINVMDSLIINSFVIKLHTLLP